MAYMNLIVRNEETVYYLGRKLFPSNCILKEFQHQNTAEGPSDDGKMPVTISNKCKRFTITFYSKLRLQYFGHLMQRAHSLEKTLMLRKTEGRRRRGQQRMR